MSFSTSLTFYLVFGACVAAAIYLRGDDRTDRERGFRIASALFFWPLYLPLLLERPSRANAIRPLTSTAPALDSLAQAIQQVESELDAALGSLDGWAEEALADEARRLHELRGAWRYQADRVRQLDELLAASKLEVVDPLAAEAAAPEATGMFASATDRRLRSDHARIENLRRLQELRGRLLDDLLGTLAWVRELVTMIHLAKFSGAPASRAEELVSQIAAAVEGLSEASSWTETASEGTARKEAILQ